MATLLLRLAAPLQAWGTESKFENRRTENYPTKSGVVGLIAAAVGRSRSESVEDLAGLRMGVRVDDPGKVMRDYHTAKAAQSYVTNRYYLQDATFLVGLESEDEEFLREIESALRNPAYPLFLGRRSCPPELPVIVGIVNQDLKTALTQAPWQISHHKKEYLKRQPWHKNDPWMHSTMILEAPISAGVPLLKDQPRSFDPRKREFRYRGLIEIPVKFLLKEDYQKETAGQFQHLNNTDHDAFSSLEM